MQCKCSSLQVNEACLALYPDIKNTPLDDIKKVKKSQSNYSKPKSQVNMPAFQGSGAQEQEGLLFLTSKWGLKFRPETCFVFFLNAYICADNCFSRFYYQFAYYFITKGSFKGDATVKCGSNQISKDMLPSCLKKKKKKIKKKGKKKERQVL